jgi:hypothetical protein
MSTRSTRLAGEDLPLVVPMVLALVAAIMTGAAIRQGQQVLATKSFRMLARNHENLCMPAVKFDFAAGSDALTQTAETRLVPVVGWLNAHPDVSVITLIATAARSDSDPELEHLAMARANALRSRLLSLGVSQTRVSVASVEVSVGRESEIGGTATLAAPGVPLCDNARRDL